MPCNVDGEHLLSCCQFLSHCRTVYCPALSALGPAVKGQASYLIVPLSVSLGTNIAFSFIFKKMHGNTR